MKPLLFAGLALALVVPAWSQLQPQNPPPAPLDGRGRSDGAPRAGQSPIGGPIQLHSRPLIGGYSGPPLRSPYNVRPETRDFAPPQPPPATMFADERFLYILRGDTLMKFDKQTLTLLQSVELPRPTRQVPDGGAFNSSLRSRTSPPLLRREPSAKPPTF